MNDEEKELLKEKVEEKKDEIKFEDKIIESPKETEPKSIGLSSQIKELNEKISMLTDIKATKAKKKGFKIPRKVRIQTRNLKKLMEKNKVQVMYLKKSGEIFPTMGEIKEGMIIVGDKIHNADGNIIWRWNGKIPTVIIPEWDLQPITMDTLTKTTEELSSIIHPQTIIIRAMEFKEALQEKSKMSGKAMIWILILGAIVLWVLFGGQIT